MRALRAWPCDGGLRSRGPCLTAWRGAGPSSSQSRRICRHHVRPWSTAFLPACCACNALPRGWALLRGSRGREGIRCESNTRLFDAFTRWCHLLQLCSSSISRRCNRRLAVLLLRVSRGAGSNNTFQTRCTVCYTILAEIGYYLSAVHSSQHLANGPMLMEKLSGTEPARLGKERWW